MTHITLPATELRSDDVVLATFVDPTFATHVAVVDTLAIEDGIVVGEVFTHVGTVLVTFRDGDGITLNPDTLLTVMRDA